MFEFEASIPTHMVIGERSVEQVGALARRYGKNALLVTGRTSMKASGWTRRLTGLLEAEGVSVELFDQVDSNPTRETVNDGGRRALASKPDLVIGLGGGSALDVAKGIAVLARFGGDIWDYIGGKVIPGPALPLIAIPSTAGTGSEVTKYAVFSDPKAGLKEGFASDYIIPQVAIIDPEVMSTVGPALTAKAGGDALAQAIEAYLTKRATPFSDLLALESVRLNAEYLPRAVAQGGDLEARLAMGWASSLAGIAITYVDVVIGHHVSEAVGAIYGTHHGETAAVLLPYAMEFNRAGTEDRLIRIAGAMGERVAGIPKPAAAEKAIAAVRGLLARIGIPARLRDLGVEESGFPGMLAILKNRDGDLKAGNTREINDESVAEFVRMAF